VKATGAEGVDLEDVTAGFTGDIINFNKWNFIETESAMDDISSQGQSAIISPMSDSD